MANVRVFSLARDLNLSSREVIERLLKLGVEAKTASSSVDEDTADKLRRALKIDALTRKRKRVYGSEEDEDDRDRLAQEQAEKIAAERAAREKAAQEAKAAAEARKSGRGRKRTTKKGAAPEEPAPALAHAAGAPRLAPKSATPPRPVVVEEEQIEPSEAPMAVPEEEVPAAALAEAAAPPAPRPVAPAVPPPPGIVRKTVTAPRLGGPVRPIAPASSPPPSPPPSPAAAPPAARGLRLRRQEARRRPRGRRRYAVLCARSPRHDPSARTR
jgi:translation initiation factor IF-2